MKRVRFFTMTSMAAGIILFSSCNSNSDKKAEENKTDSLTTITTITSPSGPTEVMIVKHKVANYGNWKPGYEAHDSARLANGLHSYVIARGVEDSNMVLVAMTMDDVNKAKAMGSDPGLKDVMKKAGVMGTPEIDYLHSVLNDTTSIQQTIRLMIRYKVKDYDAWKKSFDSNKQVRADAGLTDRVVAYTVGDNHNITLVFAVADMDKAKAFLDSKDLKERREAAGVEGPVTVYFYRIVQKY
ncbi:MAG TPA: hypothetical protein VK483_16055 [Chitinophagaceae bacterium]|nr:hypothetical protein [Chitinophagaceae bacterium]